MSDNKVNINDDVLGIKKKILNDKEEDIMKSQISQNKLEKKIRKLELKKQNIIKCNKWILGSIIFTAVYDVIMITILILFFILFTNKINLITLLNKKIYVIGLALGVVSISVIGAYASANIWEKLKHNYRQKWIFKISKRITEKEIHLNNEIYKQENLKKEITDIMNELDSGLEINVTEYKQEVVDYEAQNISSIVEKIKYRHLTRIKKRDNLNNRN